ncbi:MAG TPA: ABC transporter permease subunit [Tepidisphaeraceae bacterium]|nr:ABC transporter permease subunit [Tepidisphaeraceae bacterium]
MRLAGISPITPIFTRELRAIARRKRTYLLRTAFLGLFTLILLAVWASLRDLPSDSSYAIQAIQSQNEAGSRLFAAFSMFNIILLGAIGPLLTCTSINSERLANTMPVLLMTPLSSWQIVIGKLTSRLATAAMLLVISIPVLAVTRMLGGVELWQIGHSLLFAFAVVFCGASVGLFFSAITSRPYAAILFSYGFFGGLYIALPISLALIAATWFPAWFRSGPPAFVMWHPMASAYSILPQMGDELQFWPGLVVQLVIGTLALIASTFLIRRRISFRKERGSYTMRSAPTQLAIVAPADAEISSIVSDESIATPPPLSKPALEYAEAGTPVISREVGSNPVLWREIRRTLLAKRPILRYLTIGAIILLFIAMYAAQWRFLFRQEEVHILLLCLAQGALLLLVGATAASSVATEKESDTWQLIVSTPLSGREIVYGKILGMLSRLVVPAVLVFFHVLVFTIFGPLHWIASIVALLTLAGFMLPWIPIGLWLSLRLNRTTNAVVVILVLQLLLYAGLPAAIALVCQLFKWDEEIVGTAFAIEPFYYIAHAIDESPIGFGDRFQLYDIRGWWMSAASWLFVFGSVLLFHFLLAWFGTQAIIRGFDRIVSRAPSTT